MTDELRKAAEEYARKQNIGVPGAVVHSFVCNAYAAGAQYERERILGMLRSEEAANDRTAANWYADWIEEKLK